MVKEPSVRRKRAYELPGMSMLPGTQDPISQIENQALKDLSNEYRQLRIEEMIAKKRKQISSGPSSGIQSQKDNLELFKLFNEIQKMNQPSESVDKTLEYLKFFNTMMQGQGSPGFFEQFARAKELGILHDADPGNPNKFSVEMEKLRGERMLTAKKIDLDLTKLRLEQQNGQEKLALLAQFLSPFVAIQGNRMAGDMRDAGRRMGENLQNPRNPGDPTFNQFLENSGIVPPGSLSGKTGKMLISCDCGFSESMLVPIPPPASLSCPGCGKHLSTAPQSDSDAETKTQWK